MIHEIGALPKSHKILWVVLRIIMLIWGIYGLLHGSVVEFLEAIFAIIFTHLWDFFQIFGTRSFIIEVPFSSQTALNIFIFVAVVIGSTLNNRTTFHHFDLFTHFVAGFASAWFGYDFANIIFRKRGTLGPGLSAFTSLTFALALSVGWEIYEFSMDSIYGLNLQVRESGVIDTMVDFVMCAIGAVTGMLIITFLRNGIIGRNKEKVIEYKNRQEEIRLLKDKLYSEYIQNNRED